MAILKLKKPVMIDGKETTEISYDLESLTGEDISNAVKQLQKSGIIVGMVEIDSNYHTAIFAQASGLAIEDIKRLSAKDYNSIITLVRDFFLADTEDQ